MSETLAGLQILRTHGCEKAFEQMFDKLQDDRNSVWYALSAANGWIGLWTDLILVAYIACVTFTCTATSESTISYFLQLFGLFIHIAFSYILLKVSVAVRPDWSLPWSSL